jgi:hypothetical protein
LDTRFFYNDFASARIKLKEEMEGKSGEDILMDNAWMAYIDFKENEVAGLDGLLNIAKSNNELPKVVCLVARMFTWEHYNHIAVNILDDALRPTLIFWS